MIHAYRRRSPAHPDLEFGIGLALVMVDLDPVLGDAIRDAEIDHFERAEIRKRAAPAFDDNNICARLPGEGDAQVAVTGAVFKEISTITDATTGASGTGSTATVTVSGGATIPAGHSVKETE
ncbi:hypothetical protein QM467_13870 [Rhodoblastus sp. 17X3]|uniref:hypothetical protein n=1 Tax=Rhodoblastus sp. 17X3 TaxID=3047026 RepID=UPI0024B80B20|nr:hypothetical protein [Rhodoblastus sp. 17X3]MDI9849144.1 hypothetical protein [Rhodoblastus sp. 17X3]